MEQYVGILLSSQTTSQITHLRKNISEYIRFYNSYKEFMMQVDPHCFYVLVPFDFSNMQEVVNFAEHRNVPVALYYFIHQECKFYELCDLDPSNLAKGEQNDVLKLQRGFEQIRLHVHDIMYIESDKVYIMIHLRYEALRFRMRLSELYELLNHQHFQRCHQSYIVNMHYIYTLKRYEILLQNGVKIPISKTYTKKIRIAYEQQYAQG